MSFGSYSENPAQQQFVESYLGFAKYLAIELCPKSLYYRSLPDLIGEASLALVEIVMRPDFADILEPTPYLAACLRGAIKGAILEDNSLIKMDTHARAKVRAEGQEQMLHIASLEEAVHWDDDEEWNEPYATPILPTTAAPVPDPAKRAQVEEYLSLLSSRTQTILRLRYGLGEDDERAYSVIEIAAYLGLTREIVNGAVHNGMAKLRALVEGKATTRRYNGCTCISYSASYDHPITQAQEATLGCAYTQLQAEGGALTGKRLAQAAGVSAELACRFLCVREPERSKEGRARERQRRLGEAYERLSALGKPFSSATLAREAHVGDHVARAFLKERRSRTSATV